MTKYEMIQLIGDLLVEIDVMRGSLVPDLLERRELDEFRKTLGRKQRELAGKAFAENSSEYIRITDEILGINEEIKEKIHDVEMAVETISNIGRFLSNVDKLLGIAV